MKSCTPRARLGLLPVALSCAFGASAQSVSNVFVLPEAVVTASRVATPITDVIADVSVIDRATLELAGQSSVRDLLAQLPGVQIASNGSYRSTTSMLLRGAATSQTLVLIDGVRVGSATAGGASLDNLPLERIERIEVLRGAASALYGPDAVGGVVQIFTRAPSKTLQANASAGAGSDGQQQLSAHVSASDGALGFSVGASREKASGISAIINPASFNYNPDADGFNAASVDVRLSAKLGGGHGLNLALLRSDTDYQFDGTPYPNPLGLTNLSTDARGKTGLGHASLAWDAQWLANWHSTLTLGSSNEQSLGDYVRVADGAFGGSTQFNTNRRQATWQHDIRLERDVLSLMVESRNETVDSSTAYTVTSRDVRSALVSYAFNRAGWNALLVARNDDNSQFGNFGNWAASGGVRVADGLRAVASVGTSFQAPTFNQLYYPGFGNPTLQPQRNRAAEAGLKYDLDALSLSATVYNNDIQGFIMPVTNTQSARAVLRGVTLSAQATSGDTRYSVSYDYTDPRSYSSVASQDDLRLVRVAHHVLNARVSHQAGTVNYFGELRLSSDREDNNLSFSGRDLLPGYTLLNVGARWQVQKNLTLLGRVNNLTDAQYQLANGYSMPGRNVFASLNWSL